ncbi:MULTISPECIES: hypothetical protein [Bacillus cereus group]|uniref:hypothetical protein n=1 Tax=Bacillus cereus group TaxID=86661 RepID=UPI0001A099BA|nr:MULTISPECIES: hypothetical protein [Bacillus cereus group]EEL48442.1 ABC transporter [Bacillus cereus Rock3-44]
MKPILYFVKKLQFFSGKTLYINLVGMVFVSLCDGIAILLLIPMLSISGILNVDAGVIPIPRGHRVSAEI